MTPLSLIVGILALLVAEPGAETRRHAFTGTWVADLGSQSGLPTDVYSVRGGIYECLSCVPPRRFPADGQLRAVDENVQEAVTTVDPRTISTRIVRPDLARTTRMRVARDGATATYVSIDRRRGITGRLRTEYLAGRVAHGPAGSHAVSGSWQGIRYVSVPLQLRTTILDESESGLSYRTGTGYSYAARYDGGFVPIAGPYDGGISVSVTRLDAARIEERRRRGGRDVEVRTYTLLPDGRSMEIVTTNLATNGSFRVIARRRGRP